MENRYDGIQLCILELSSFEVSVGIFGQTNTGKSSRSLVLDDNNSASDFSPPIRRLELCHRDQTCAELILVF